ncbi:unnamed protein product [Rotaria sordida]|uniref:Uncharacterized protein n=1 Tax=Rotaria sordida TaxID=392033 RepID=A0A815NWC1_9BILA|nr:unnamed protein product [Rotaria sordida]CAF3974730.1 unnamed protein product [Rotaria sordida]
MSSTSGQGQINRYRCGRNFVVSMPSPLSSTLRISTSAIIARENLLVEEIDNLIRQFMLGPYHRAPYSSSFRWTTSDRPYFSYYFQVFKMTMIKDIDDVVYDDIFSYPYDISIPIDNDNQSNDCNEDDNDFMFIIDLLMDLSSEFEDFWNFYRLSEEENFLIIDYLCYCKQDYDELMELVCNSEQQQQHVGPIDSNEDNEIVIIHIIILSILVAPQSSSSILVMDDNLISKDQHIQDQLFRPTTLLPVSKLTTATIQQNISNQTIEIIDLCTPTMDSHDSSFEQHTIQFVSPSKIIVDRFPTLEYRLSILPWFPFNEQQEQGYPLFVNIPPHQLTEKELTFRHSTIYKPAFEVINHNLTMPSFLREKYQLYFDDLIKRLKVDMTLLDFNYIRLNQYIRAVSYQRMDVFNMRPNDILQLDEKEYPLALEFYLQFDIHMFYMKTCEFRHARPRKLNEGLFCIEEPEARYELSSCDNCGLCYPQYDMTYRTKKSIVEFNRAHKHTFINGYQSILNCSASCHIRNIIYSLICPCGEYDYIGVTTQSLHDRLKMHREHGNRIIHEFLIGQDNIKRDLPRSGKSNDILAKDRMRLYQHSAQCPIALQIFLDANPQYWCFIPMQIEEAQTSEEQIIERANLSNQADLNRRSKHETHIYVESIPKPPNTYVFSNRQIELQSEYFHYKKDKILPNRDIDLYNATIVALLPETCTEMFRLLIESLFITHAETKLNSIGNILKPIDLPDYNPWLIRGDHWCQGLLRRPKPTPNTNQDNKHKSKNE